MSNVTNKGITKSMLIMLLITLLVIGLAVYLMPTVHAAGNTVYLVGYTPGQADPLCYACEWDYDTNSVVWNGYCDYWDTCGEHMILRVYTLVLDQPLVEVVEGEGSFNEADISEYSDLSRWTLAYEAPIENGEEYWFDDVMTNVSVPNGIQDGQFVFYCETVKENEVKILYTDSDEWDGTLSNVFDEVSYRYCELSVDTESGEYSKDVQAPAGYEIVSVQSLSNPNEECANWVWTDIGESVSGIFSEKFANEEQQFRVVCRRVDPNVTNFDAALILDQNASVPNASVAFTAAAGTGMAAVQGTSLEVLAPTAENGVTGTPTVGSAAFAAGDATVTEADGITIAANQKAVVKPVSIDFNGVTFAQPGVFRYLITEPSTGSGLTYDTQLGDAENGVRYQRVLDVYVQRVDNADTGATSYQIAGYVFHEVANAPAVGATAAADKSSGFVHEYDTKTVTLESRAAGNQSSIDKYFAYTITVQNPNNSVFTVSADWINAADALNPTANPATKYDTAAITAANTAEWSSNADGSLSKTIYLRNGQKVELDGIPAGATYAISVADEDYSPSWAIGGDNGTTNATGDRVLNAMEDVVFTLTREGVVPTGVMLSAVPGLIIMAGALVAVVAMRKRKEDQAEA